MLQIVTNFIVTNSGKIINWDISMNVYNFIVCIIELCYENRHICILSRINVLTDSYTESITVKPPISQ